MKEYSFDLNLARECSRAFSASTGLGCTVSDKQGNLICEHGFGCASCDLCQAAHLPKENCNQAHIYGMTEAERFGGRYIYFCPMGLTCFVSPIIGEAGSTAKITVGPFLMVELEDFIGCELDGRLQPGPEARRALIRRMEQIPYVPPQKVQELSVLLFMAAGFLNNVAAQSRLRQDEESGLLQGQISAYISRLKLESAVSGYPMQKERALLLAISHCDREKARLYTQELLASAFASSGGSLDWIRSRAAELLVLISRTAMDCGADEGEMLTLNQELFRALSSQRDFPSLSAWFYHSIDKYMDAMFAFPHARHASSIQSCIQYIQQHYTSRLTLEDTARAVGLSPDYLSRIFRQETGVTFTQYLNQLRIQKARGLIRHSGLRLTDVCQMVGYDDQSYFTKVFRRIVGMPPNEYRRKVQAAGKFPHHQDDSSIHTVCPEPEALRSEALRPEAANPAVFPENPAR